MQTTRGFVHQRGRVLGIARLDTCIYLQKQGKKKLALVISAPSHFSNTTWVEGLRLTWELCISHRPLVVAGEVH